MKRNILHFLGIVLLLFLAVFAYVSFTDLIDSISGNYNRFKEEGNQEDFNFVTVKPIDIGYFEDKYGIKLEERFVFDYENNGKTLRIFAVTEEINKPVISTGKLPEEGEICVDKTYADANKLAIGDKISVKDREFKVAGYLYLPDYVYIVKNEQDILPDPKNFGIAVLNRSEFEKVSDPQPVHYYVGKFEKENPDLQALRDELNKKAVLLRFQERWDNLRIVTTEMKMTGAGTMSYVISIVIFVISTGLLYIIMRRQLDLMHQEIGTLYALGYKGSELMRVFMIFPFILWLLGSIPGIAAGHLVARPFIDYYATWFNVPLFRYVYNYSTTAYSLVVPAVFLFGATYQVLRSKLRKSVAEILSSREVKTVGKHTRLGFIERLPFKSRLTLKQGLLHPAREIILVLGVAFSAFLLFYAVGAIFSFEELLKSTFGEVFTYEYMYLLNGYQTDDLPSDAEPFNVLSFEVKGEKTKISVYGIKENSKFVNLKDAKGDPIKLSGLVISRAVADKFNLDEGDEITLISQLTGESYRFKVSKIAEVYYGNSAFMDLSEFNKKFGIPEDAYLGIYSGKELKIDKSKLLTKFDREYMIKVFNATTDQMNQIIQLMGFVAFMIALTIIYVLSSLTISENSYPIALFKILGYRNREITSIFLGFSNFSILLGFIIGIPVFNLFFRVLYMQLIKNLDFSIKMSLGLREIALSLGVLAVAYLISRYICRRNVLKIQPSIVLKEQRE
jgi:putative ABC transport system permease protein